MTFPNLLTGDYLFQDPVTEPSGWYGVFTAAFALLFVVSAFVYWRRNKLVDNPVQRRLLRRLSKAGMWLAGVDLVLAALRYTEFPYLSKPFWTLLLLVAMVGVVGYFIYYISEYYPLQLWQLQENQAQRRYRPQTRRRPETGRPRPVRPAIRGKRRK